MFTDCTLFLSFSLFFFSFFLSFSFGTMVEHKFRGKKKLGFFWTPTELQANTSFDCFPLHLGIFMASAQKQFLGGGPFCVEGWIQRIEEWRANHGVTCWDVREEEGIRGKQKSTAFHGTWLKSWCWSETVSVCLCIALMKVSTYSVLVFFKR